jgi:hypothetical protein
MAAQNGIALCSAARAASLAGVRAMRAFFGLLRVKIIRRVFARETLLCALALAPGSVFVLAQLPPLWRDWDSLLQINNPPGHNTLLQFPALYPFVSRLPVLLVSGWQWLLHDGALHINAQAPVALNDAGIYLLIIAQQFSLVLALALFIVTAAQDFWRRALLVVLALFTTAFFLVAQLISSEALGLILMIPLTTAALHLFQNERAEDSAALVTFGLLLYLNIMTRHASAVLAALLPLGYCFALLASLAKRSQHQWRYWFRKIWRATIVGLAAILLANLTTRALCAIFKEPYRSVVSRTAIYRLDEIDRLPANERAALIRELQDKTNDPLTKEAIPRLLEVKGYWGHSLIELDRMIKERYPRMRSKERRKLADKYLAEICALYYQAAPPILVGNITDAISRALLQATPDLISHLFLRIGIDSLHLYRENEDLLAHTKNLSVCSPAAETRIAAFAARHWFTYLNRIPCGLLLFASTLVATALLLWRKFPGAALIAICSICATNLLLMIGIFFVSMYSERQVLPECFFAFAAFGILLGQMGVVPRNA